MIGKKMKVSNIRKNIKNMLNLLINKNEDNYGRQGSVVSYKFIY